MSRRTTNIVLIASLVINIFLVGGLAGAALMWRGAGIETAQPAAGIGRPARLRQAAMSLSPAYRRGLRQTVRQTILSLRPLAEQARAARREAGQLLIQPALDRPALEAAMGRARAADIAIRTRLESSVVDFAATLPRDQRVTLGDALIRNAGPAPQR